MKEVVIIKAGGTNFASIEDALERIGCKVFYAKSEDDITNADKLLLPGVGSMQNALPEDLYHIIPKLTQPILGICLGMQMLFKKSAENPKCNGFGVFDNEILRFKNDLIVPHTGWNRLIFTEDSHFFSGIPEGHVYFTHSYYAPMGDYTKGYSQYGECKISAVVQKDNFYGFQFHPERSGSYGEILLRKFIENT
jgi:imidazole glycerol-phosphate synthase subunit HisH